MAKTSGAGFERRKTRLLVEGVCVCSTLRAIYKMIFFFFQKNIICYLWGQPVT
jgi:hypothetical protein